MSISAGKVVFAGNEGDGGKEGAYVCLLHGSSPHIHFCAPDPRSSIQTARFMPYPMNDAVVKLPMSSI